MRLTQIGLISPWTRPHNNARLLLGTKKHWTYYLMEAPGLTYRIISAGHQPSMQQLGSVRPLSATFWMLKCNKKQRLTPLATLPNSISFDMRGFCKYKAIESMYLAGADLEVQDQDGNTALAIASTSGDTRSVKTLLHLGADRNSRDTNGFTPLVHAIRQLHVEICCILLEDGATEIDVKDDEGRTPLIHAVLGRSFQMRHDIEWEDEMMTEYVNWKFGLVESGSLSYSHEGDAHMTEDEFLEDD